VRNWFGKLHNAASAGTQRSHLAVLEPGRDGCRKNSGCTGSTPSKTPTVFLRQHCVAEFNGRFLFSAVQHGIALTAWRAAIWT
jgi:hypothetical protein